MRSYKIGLSLSHWQYRIFVYRMREKRDSEGERERSEQVRTIRIGKDHNHKVKKDRLHRLYRTTLRSLICLQKIHNDFYRVG